MTQTITSFTWSDLQDIFKEEAPSIPLRLMFDDGTLQQVLPEIAQLYGVEQPKAHHPEGHAFEHTMQVLDEMRKLTDNPAYLMAALCHDVGKGITPMELRPKHHNHEKNGVPIAQTICERLNVPADVMEATLVGTENHGKFHRVFDMRAVRLVDFLNFHHESALGIKGIAYLGLCDHRGRNNPKGNHECYDAWFEMWAFMTAQPALPGERPDDTRKRHAKAIDYIRKNYMK
ncbi:CCA tRNA nucleotidyltransferase (plasmid) [Jeotgalibacillus malaysiensis]|uniref:CCA tRNA nucleotidyltransferase n=1 Tax=Jeotgalibacillus malaysiensis TaxID=1508404 RepID=A0A0B5AY85_9BACL|nr:HD domain-containing protein [Jeotgalibacillus malaysiensis]AJD93642.1 CCA tRNA nucleotidyltransferase [Jeotgalibacillus malaysiensis]